MGSYFYGTSCWVLRQRTSELRGHCRGISLQASMPACQVLHDRIPGFRV